MANTKNTAASKKDVQNKAEVKSGTLRIGKTLYNVNVHFGKIPLEDILKNRILNEAKRA